MKLKPHPDWHWIVNHAWSTRFVALAFLLSGAEVALPYFADKTPIEPRVFAIAVGLVTGAAFVARLVAQEHELPSDGSTAYTAESPAAAGLCDRPCKVDVAKS